MEKTGRNDPCPCGSNRKYKQCCMYRTEARTAGERSGAMEAFTVSRAFQAALEHHRAGRLPQAESSYRQILRINPTHPDALHLLGMIAYQTERSDVAVDLIKRAINANPSNPFFYSDLGNILQNRGNLEEAIASYRKALSFKTDLAEVYSNLGKALQDQGKLDEAVASYRKALSFKPDLVEALSNLGNVLLDQGNREEAIASYRTVLAFKPDYAEAHYNLGNVLRDQGQVDEALASYRTALSFKTDLIPAHINLGNALRDRGKLDEAVASYRKALALNPHVTQAHINLANSFLDQGKLDGAVASYRAALSIDPDSTQAHIGMGNALREAGKLEEAIACYRRVIGIDPDNRIATHLLTALLGGDSESPPGEYVEILFDNIAHTFDTHLLDNLKYNVPEDLVAMIRDYSDPSPAKWDILDLGCGTGLVGVAIASYARRLVGVDLSSRMLAKARERGLYHRLERSDLVSMMQGEPAGSYDVVTAADVFIYVGDIDNTVREVKRLLRSGGLFGFSLENLDVPSDYKLMPTTRYAHSSAYINKLAVKYGFHIHRMAPKKIRLENDCPVDGRLVLLGII
jgi:predicted TPR repeat methyltransferase